jgi:hypothetical protein
MSSVHCKHCCPCCSTEKPSEKAKGMGSQLIVIFVILLFFVRVGQLQNEKQVDTQPANTIDRPIPSSVSY